MAASNYSVNIKLNTKPAIDQLGKLEKRVNILRRNLNTPLRIESKAVMLKKQQLALDDRKFATMKITRRLGDQVRKFEEKGLKLDKLRLELNNAARHTAKGRLETARSANKFVAEELKTIEKALQANIQTAGVDRDRIRSLTQVIGLKRTEAALNRTAGKTAAFMDNQRKGIGPNNLLGLPSTEMLKPSTRGIKILDLGTQGRQQTSVPFGPQIATAKQLEQFGTGASAMSINARFAQQKKRIKFQHELNMLEVKGVRTAKLRAKMGELVDAQNRKQFGSIQRINNELENGITKLKNQLKITNETNKKQNQIASGRFARGGNFGRIGGKIGPALPPNMAPRGFDFQSAAISGAFPLLFGQGPLAALGGGLGGGFGGQFGGQMGGFAGGLIGTAVVSGIQAQVTAVAQLGQAFNSITPNIQALTASLGIAGTEEERRIKLIEETQGRQAALAAVTENMNKAIGVDGVENLKKFGETSQLLANAFTLAMTKMQAALAPLFELLATPFAGPIKAQQRAEQIAAGGGDTDATLLGLQEQLSGIASTKQNRAKRNRLKAQIEARKEELAELGKIEITAKNIRMIEDSKLKKIRQQNDLLRAKINGNFEEVQLAQEVEAKIQEMVEAGAKINEIDRQRVEDTMKLNKDLEKQAELAEKIRQSFKDLGQSIATDISDGIKGMIRGTSTLNDLLNNVMNKLIDTAFNMAFFGNPQGTLGGGGLFGSIFSGLGSMFGGNSGLPSSQVLGQRASAMTGIPMDLPAGSFNITRASGGPVKGGTGYLVGERGPEMFTPGVSGMITPNHALGGTTNVVVNVDASGSSVEGDEEQGRELGRIISAAIQSELIKQKRPGGMLP